MLRQINIPRQTSQENCCGVVYYWEVNVYKNSQLYFKPAYTLEVIEIS